MDKKRRRQVYRETLLINAKTSTTVSSTTRRAPFDVVLFILFDTELQRIHMHQYRFIFGLCRPASSPQLLPHYFSNPQPPSTMRIFMLFLNFFPRPSLASCVCFYSFSCSLCKKKKNNIVTDRITKSFVVVFFSSPYCCVKFECKI